MRQTRDISNAKTFSCLFSSCRRDHQRGRNPRQPGQTEFWKRRRPAKSCQDRERITASHKPIVPKNFQPPQLASILSKGKYARAKREKGQSLGLPFFLRAKRLFVTLHRFGESFKAIK